MPEDMLEYAEMRARAAPRHHRRAGGAATPGMLAPRDGRVGVRSPEISGGEIRSIR